MDAGCGRLSAGHFDMVSAQVSFDAAELVVNNGIAESSHIERVVVPFGLKRARKSMGSESEAKGTARYSFSGSSDMLISATSICSTGYLGLRRFLLDRMKCLSRDSISESESFLSAG